MVLEKRQLNLEDIEAQTALELPDREMMALVTILVTNNLNHLSIPIEVKNNNIAVQVCAAVQALNTILAPTTLTCEVAETQ